MTSKRLTALGVYIFAGGFTLGVRKHFEVLTHFEDGPYGTETAISNGLIKEAHTTPETWPVAQYRGKVDFLYGNPPCAPWSMGSAGRETHWTEDPRVNAVRRQFGLLDQLQPDVWAWESVRPTFIKGRSLVNTIVVEANKRGYNATVLMVDGQHHGVAQIRKRLFLVLSKFHIEWDPGDVKKPVTVGQALKGRFKTQIVSGLANDVPKAFLKKWKPGTRGQKLFNQLHPEVVADAKLKGIPVKGRMGFLKYRVSLDEPSPVMLGGAHLFHPVEHRYMSVEECAAICGYPRDFKFVGSMSKQYAQVAQAVMPPVAEYLARRVAQALRVRSRVRKPGFSRVEVFADRVEHEQLDTVLQMKDGLKLVEVAVKQQRPGKPAQTPRASRPGGVGLRIRRLLLEDRIKDNTKLILEIIHKEFPHSKATAADVSWNRRKLAGKE